LSQDYPNEYGATRKPPLAQTLPIATTLQDVAYSPVSRLQKYNEKPRNLLFLFKNNFFYDDYLPKQNLFAHA